MDGEAETVERLAGGSVRYATDPDFRRDEDQRAVEATTGTSRRWRPDLVPPGRDWAHDATVGGSRGGDDGAPYPERGACPPGRRLTTASVPPHGTLAIIRGGGRLRAPRGESNAHDHVLLSSAGRGASLSRRLEAHCGSPARLPRSGGTPRCSRSGARIPSTCRRQGCSAWPARRGPTGARSPWPRIHAVPPARPRRDLWTRCTRVGARSRARLLAFFCARGPRGPGTGRGEGDGEGPDDGEGACLGRGRRGTRRLLRRG